MIFFCSERNLWVEDDRPRTHGNIFFVENNLDLTLIKLKCNFKEATMKVLRTINEYCATSPDKAIDRETLQNLTEGNKNTLSRTIERLIKQGVFEIENDFISTTNAGRRSTNKHVKLYRVADIFLANAPVISEIIEKKPQQLDKSNAAKLYPLAANHPEDKNPAINDVFLFSGQETIKALSPDNFVFPKSSIELIGLLPPNGTGTQHFTLDLSHKTHSESQSQEHKLHIDTSQSIHSVMEPQDLQTLYAMFSLTINFHIGHQKRYRHQTKIQNITPIHRLTLMKLLNMKNEPELNKKILGTIDKLAAQVFKFELCGQNVSETMEHRLFDIVGREMRGNNPKYPAAKLYIKWNVDILKAMLNKEHFFLLPPQVLHSDLPLFAIYMQVRKVAYAQKRQISSVDISNLKLASLVGLSLEETASELYNSVKNNPDFEIDHTSNNIDQLNESGCFDPKAVINSTVYVGMLAGIKFHCSISKDHKNKPVDCFVMATYTLQDIYIAAQPEHIQNMLTKDMVNGQLVLTKESEQKLAEAGRAKTFPGIFSDLKAVAPRIEDDLKEVDLTDTEKALEAPLPPFCLPDLSKVPNHRIATRQFFGSIRHKDVKYIYSRLTSDETLMEIINTCADGNEKRYEKLQQRIMMAIKKLDYPLTEESCEEIRKETSRAINRPVSIDELLSTTSSKAIRSLLDEGLEDASETIPRIVRTVVNHLSS